MSVEKFHACLHASGNDAVFAALRQLSALEKRTALWDGRGEVESSTPVGWSIWS